MLLRFHDFNHCPQGKNAVADIITIMSAQLEALGHRVAEPGDFLIGRGLNLVLESFAEEDYLQRIAAAHGRGARFLFVATELPTEVGFNGGTDPGMICRQQVFPEAARYAEGILHLVAGADVTRWYSQHAPSAYAELGYAPSLVRDTVDEDPDYDFCFFGQASGRREVILSRLAMLGRTLVIDRLWLSQKERDRQARRAKVVVQLLATDEVGYPSSTRCAMSICRIGRPVVAEPHSAPGGWDSVVHFSSSMDAFYRDARSMARGDWRSERNLQLAALEATFPPDACLGRALREIGVR